MNKNTIIALVVGLIIGGLAVWLFMFFAQGTGMGTAIGLNKVNITPIPATTTGINWNKYVTVADKHKFSVKNGASVRKINENTLEIITPDSYGQAVFCGCDEGDRHIACSAEGGEGVAFCDGVIPGCGDCEFFDADGEPIAKHQGGGGER